MRYKLKLYLLIIPMNYFVSCNKEEIATKAIAVEHDSDMIYHEFIHP